MGFLEDYFCLRLFESYIYLINVNCIVFKFGRLNLKNTDKTDRIARENSKI